MKLSFMLTTIVLAIAFPAVTSSEMDFLEMGPALDQRAADVFAQTQGLFAHPPKMANAVKVPPAKCDEKTCAPPRGRLKVPLKNQSPSGLFGPKSPPVAQEAAKLPPNTEFEHTEAPVEVDQRLTDHANDLMDDVCSFSQFGKPIETPLTKTRWPRRKVFFVTSRASEQVLLSEAVRLIEDSSCFQFQTMPSAADLKDPRQGYLRFRGSARTVAFVGPEGTHSSARRQRSAAKNVKSLVTQILSAMGAPTNAIVHP
jgi:hypothetical protein